MILLACLIVLISYSTGCPREPSVYHSRVHKTPGDNGFEIKINENPDKYVPGKVYTMYIMGSRTYDKLQHFRRFTVNVASSKDPQNLTPQQVGSFQLFGDNLSKFNEECVNTLSEANDLPKTEVFFMWTAPPPGSGCVVFRAMVLEDPYHWYADDGNLSKTFCERSEDDIKYDENDCCACDEAKYNMVFEGIWSKQTHPRDFPFSVWLTHFSDIIGASHERNFSFWGEGHIASEGFKSLAEWGSVRLMESELRAKSRYLRSIIKAAGLWYPKVNTNTSTAFKVDRRHHLISLSSMFGPSPDWVVGVNGLNLCLKNCSWIEHQVIDLYPWDAGVDSGHTYMSPNIETKPKERMFRITTKYPEDPRAPFYDSAKENMVPMAKLHLTREKLIPKSCDEKFLTSQVETLDEDENEDASKPECQVTPYTQWSECTVTCGKGLRMRSRDYLYPQKAAAAGCSRQLVSKEMCVAPVPECDGTPDSKDSMEILEDNEGICATTPWSQWSDCSATCGVGFISRTRRFLDPTNRKKCSHVQTIEREKCMGDPCVETETQDPICPVTDWSEWSPCSVSCGQGIKIRRRLLLVEQHAQHHCTQRIKLEETLPCTDLQDCKLDEATAKEVCVQESVYGPCTGYFNRFYFDPSKLTCVAFIYGGCRGNRNNFKTFEECMESCQAVKESLSLKQTTTTTSQPYFNQSSSPTKINLNLPQDCVVSDWSIWSLCSATCGSSFQEKFREIKQPPQNGGKACPKRLVKKRRCNVPACR